MRSMSSRSSSNIESLGRRGPTAIAAKAPMWLMPANEFLALDALRPQQELAAEGKMVVWQPSMETVFFVSHQWTALDHPDHSGLQLRTFQRLLERMLAGTCPETAPGFIDAVSLRSNVKVSPTTWRKLAKDAYIWMDYISVRAAVLACEKGRERADSTTPRARSTD